MIDTWVAEMMERRREFESGQGPKPSDFSDYDMAMAVLTFIFASQDASTASITWAMWLLAQNPAILQKVRDEQDRMRPKNGPLTPENMDGMAYTRQVAKEVLRYRPPVIMVPYESVEDTNLMGHKIPKGSIVVPSVYPAAHDPTAFKDPETFDPERFNPERQEDVKSSKYNLVFGHGPHLCLGREYAMSHLVAFIAYMASTCDWKITLNEKSSEMMIMATIYPLDGCLLSITPRKV